MRVLGMHILDAAIILLFLAAIIVVGVVTARSVKHQTDFFLGGRKLGRWLQFFLNFGNMTDSTGAVVISSEVFRQGVGGLWIGFQTLFITPFYWFSAVWYRRVRLITMADLFVDRFNSKPLATAYALFNMFLALFLLGMGNVVTYKVVSAMIVKPEADYTAQERQMVERFKEYRQFKQRADAGSLSEVQRQRFDALDSMNKQGELKSFISYVQPLPFYFAYTAFICIYIVLGGLRAAAFCDAFQGVLVVIMSVLMIPIGLHRIGGFGSLHQIVPEQMFRMFGTVAMSEYTWYSIGAIVFASLIQIFGLIHNITISGSARDENAARIGAVSGGFSKRFVLIAWAFCGLIAIAIFSRGISDPDNAWGTLSLTLLGPGLMGLMLSGMLLGHMPAVGASAVSISALATRNIYEPLFQGRTQKHYVRAGQWFVSIVLMSAVLFALLFKSAVNMMVMVITFNTFFGAAVLLTFFWRRITAGAVKLGLVIWVVLIGVVPWALPSLELFRRHPALLVQTSGQTVQVMAGATAQDVAAGRATRVGQPISRSHNILPGSVFFERVARIDPEDPKSPLEGLGRFHIEAYLLHMLGIPVSRFTSAGLVTTRWLFDGLFPFFMLILFSYFTRQAEPERVRRFYTKMKTPVLAAPEEDEKEMALSYAHPERFDHLKLLPSTNWEFSKWDRRDFAGFATCWGVVGGILLFLWTLLRIGA